MRIPDFTQQMTIGEMFGPAMEIVSPGEADRYFEALVRHNISAYGQSREEATRVMKASLGYYAGYYGHDVQRRVQDLFNCIHPILGPVSESVNLTPKEIFEKGVAAANHGLVTLEQPS